MAAKLVLVTGASSGIGEATALRYGAAGAHVLLLARNAERLYGVAHAIREAGGTATAFPIDLQGSEATKETAARIEAEIGTPDLLINNAGAGRWLPLVETSPEDARAMIDVPYLAAFNLTRAFAPAMIARRAGGIVFVTSPASYLAWPNASAYIAARRALAGFAEGLQSELKGTGVAVTLVVLGTVDTPYWEHNPDSLENVPSANPWLMPTLSPAQAADAIFAGAARKTLFVVKPAVYRALFVLNALFPKTVASQLRRAAKKARGSKG
ncbi:MAG: SDR family NAD(P)-dependent oxidoreductase [Methyloceanibacter sp.]|uniref:SDR family NAD(P)-dependent oxidoreductase n=1 Tax=Methyloceanibacter sp. TaxID=1965321 RepID=UPI003EDE91F7